MADTHILNALRSIFIGMDDFSDDSVVIDDWSILDGPNQRAPFIILETADSFEARQDTDTPETTWFIPVTLVVRFTDWKESLLAFRNARNLIIDKMNSGSGERSAGFDNSINGRMVDIVAIRGEENIAAYYDRYIENLNDALPVYLYQTMVFQAEEY